MATGNTYKKPPAIPSGKSGIVPPSTSQKTTDNASKNKEIIWKNFIGKKVWIQNSKEATLKFYGKTKFAPGQWCGVVLEEAEGKNDGSVNGTRYFNCQPGYGLFAPVSRVSIINEPPRDPLPDPLPEPTIAASRKSVSNPALSRIAAPSGLQSASSRSTLQLSKIPSLYGKPQQAKAAQIPQKKEPPVMNNLDNTYVLPRSTDSSPKKIPVGKLPDSLLSPVSNEDIQFVMPSCLRNKGLDSLAQTPGAASGSTISPAQIDFDNVIFNPRRNDDLLASSISTDFGDSSLGLLHPSQMMDSFVPEMVMPKTQSIDEIQDIAEFEVNDGLPDFMDYELDLLRVEPLTSTPNVPTVKPSQREGTFCLGDKDIGSGMILNKTVDVIRKSEIEILDRKLPCDVGERPVSTLTVSGTSIDTGYQGDCDFGDFQSNPGTNAATTPVDDDKPMNWDSNLAALVTSRMSSQSSSMHSRKAVMTDSDSDFFTDMTASRSESEAEGDRNKGSRGARVIDGKLFFAGGNNCPPISIADPSMYSANTYSASTFTSANDSTLSNGTFTFNDTIVPNPQNMIVNVVSVEETKWDGLPNLPLSADSSDISAPSGSDLRDEASSSDTVTAVPESDDVPERKVLKGKPALAKKPNTASLAAGKSVKDKALVESKPNIAQKNSPAPKRAKIDIVPSIPAPGHTVKKMADAGIPVTASKTKAGSSDSARTSRTGSVTEPPPNYALMGARPKTTFRGGKPTSGCVPPPLPIKSSAPPPENNSTGPTPASSIARKAVKGRSEFASPAPPKPVRLTIASTPAKRAAGISVAGAVASRVSLPSAGLPGSSGRGTATPKYAPHNNSTRSINSVGSSIGATPKTGDSQRSLTPSRQQLKPQPTPTSRATSQFRSREQLISSLQKTNQKYERENEILKHQVNSCKADLALLRSDYGNAKNAFNVFAILLDHSTNRLGVFDKPRIERKLTSTEIQLRDAQTTLELARQEHQNVLRDMQVMLGEHQLELAQLTDQHSCQLLAMREQAAKNLGQEQGKLHAQYEQKIKEILAEEEAKAIKEFEESQRLYRMDTEKLRAEMMSLEEKRSDAMREIERMKKHCDQEIQRVVKANTELREKFAGQSPTKKSDRALLTKLEKDVESLNAAFEMKQLDNQKLSRENRELLNTNEELRAASERCKYLEAKVAEQDVTIDRNNERERSLSIRIEELVGGFERQNKTIDSISMENEQLKYRLIHNSCTSIDEQMAMNGSLTYTPNTKHNSWCSTAQKPDRAKNQAFLSNLSPIIACGSDVLTTYAHSIPSTPTSNGRIIDTRTQLDFDESVSEPDSLSPADAAGSPVLGLEPEEAESRTVEYPKPVGYELDGNSFEVREIEPKPKPAEPEVVIAQSNFDVTIYESVKVAPSIENETSDAEQAGRNGCYGVKKRDSSVMGGSIDMRTPSLITMSMLTSFTSSKSPGSNKCYTTTNSNGQWESNGDTYKRDKSKAKMSRSQTVTKFEQEHLSSRRPSLNKSMPDKSVRNGSADMVVGVERKHVSRLNSAPAKTNGNASDFSKDDYFDNSESEV